LTYPNASGRENHASSRGIEARGGFALPATLTISNVTFTVTSTSITANFNTDQETQCMVYGLEGAWAEWYQGFLKHPSHAHAKIGLEPDTSYCIRLMAYIYLSEYEFVDVWSPSMSGYYVVKTHNAGGTGGGLVEIVP
jgi:hypothetical protein